MKNKKDAFVLRIKITLGVAITSIGTRPLRELASGSKTTRAETIGRQVNYPLPFLINSLPPPYLIERPITPVDLLATPPGRTLRRNCRFYRPTPTF